MKALCSYDMGKTRKYQASIILQKLFALTSSDFSTKKSKEHICYIETKDTLISGPFTNSQKNLQHSIGTISDSINSIESKMCLYCTQFFQITLP